MIFFFDAFNTLLNMDGLMLESPTFAKAWVREYAKYFQAGKPWMPLDALLRKLLDDLLADRRIADQFDDEARNDFVNRWRQLQFHADVIAGLKAVKEAGHKSLILSNANAKLMTRIVVMNQASTYIGVCPASDEVKAWKPDPRIYDFAVGMCSMTSGPAALVAAHVFDLDAARDRGMKTFYLPRGDFDDNNTHTVIRSIADLCAF